MTDKEMQRQIIEALEVVQDFDAAREAERRVSFLAEYLQATGTRGLVLGISGGVDSTVGGGSPSWPASGSGRAGTPPSRCGCPGVQRDEADALAALEAIAPDEEYTVNIQAGTDGLWDACVVAGVRIDEATDDYVKGNVKARQRMIAQYAVAGTRNLLVVGTDQAAEAAVGFFTKYGDGGADVVPLFGLPKRRVRDIGRHLGIPDQLISKVPTADLEDDRPMIPDEVALGVRYTVVDEYLEGGDIDPADEATILGWYRRTGHKRAMPLSPARWEAARNR